MQDRDFLKDMYLPENNSRLEREAAQGLESRLANFKAYLSEGREGLGAGWGQG